MFKPDASGHNSQLYTRYMLFVVFLMVLNLTVSVGTIKVTGDSLLMNYS